MHLTGWEVGAAALGVFFINWELLHRHLSPRKNPKGPGKDSPPRYDYPQRHFTTTGAEPSWWSRAEREGWLS